MKLGLWQRWKNRPVIPEESIAFRAAVLLAVLCGVLATLKELEFPSFSLAVVLGTVAGFVISYLRRREKNWWLQIILSVLLLWMGINFFKQLVASPYDPRIPLANLLLFMQTIHSFDLPQRRDLNYSMLVSVILIAIAGVLSHNSSFLFFLLCYILTASLAMFYNYFSVLKAKVPAGKMPAFSWMLARSLGISLMLVIITVLGFVLLPRFEGFRIRPLPISWAIRLPRLSLGRILNPAYPTLPGEEMGKLRRRNFDPDNYFGFTAFLDLNYRGKLSDEIMMRVRSTHPGYYRGIAFDYYDGFGWRLSNELPSEISSAFPPLTIYYPGRLEIPRYPLFYWGQPDQEIVQIFYIESEQPNIIFGAFRPFQLYFPSASIYVDRALGLRSPFPLEKGMVYSCISLARRLEVKRVRDTIPVGYREAYPELYRLPPLSRRVWQLSRRLTGGITNPFYKAQSILNYLLEHYPYDLEIPPFPAESEMVDYFLFEQKRGYCEHFATSMAVLLRCAGIPCRLVTGYTAGSYNPFTSFYEIRALDAHAWVEALLPDSGWVSFDATPGSQAYPQVLSEKKQKWVLAAILNYLKEQLKGIDFSFFKTGLPEFSPGGFRIPVVWGMVLLLMLGVLSLLIREIKRQKAIAAQANPIFLLYAGMLNKLERKGLVKEKQQTPLEFAGKLEQTAWSREVNFITELFCRAKYSPHKVEAAALEEAKALLRVIGSKSPKDLSG